MKPAGGLKRSGFFTSTLVSGRFVYREAVG
jgi:hypothetical protein